MLRMHSRYPRVIPTTPSAMTSTNARFPLAVLAVALAAAAHASDAPRAKYPAYPSETPAKFTPVTARDGFERREVMVPMRDGVRLHTVVLVPKGARRAGILLTRTPYDADSLTTHRASPSLAANLQGYDNATDVIVEDGYIRVVQDVRGKYGSEGDYVMNRPVHGPQNPTKVDDATDTYDTIDWLVKHVPESNGKVGTIGISYDGFEPLMSLVDAHPALKVAVPMNPMVDGWMGDDWFHHGAFRQEMIPYIYEQEAGRKNQHKFASGTYDGYDFYMRHGSAGAVGKAYGMEQLGFWNRLVAHPAYDAFWSDQAVDRVLADRPLKVPVLLVHSLWDQEDIYGAPAMWRVLHAKDPDGALVHLAMGPWHHGQSIGDGSSLGALRFGSDTVEVVPPERVAPVPRAVPEGRRARGRVAAGGRLPDRHGPLAVAAGVAARLRAGLRVGRTFALPAPRRARGLRRARRGCGVRRIRLRPRASGALPRAAEPLQRRRP